MLTEIRERLQLPVESLAMLFGTPLITVRKWLNGERKPSGAAKRLIWMIHCAMFNPSVLRKLDGWVKWAGSHKQALERVIENCMQPADSTAIIATPTEESSRHVPKTIRIRRLESVAKLGDYLGGDIHHIGAAMVVLGAMQVGQSLQECNACLSLDGLDFQTKLRLLDLKAGLIDQQLTISRTLLDWKRGKFPPPDDMPLKQPAFGPGEQAFPATLLVKAGVHAADRPANIAV